MQDMRSPWDAVVLGAGIGGLSAAIRLRQSAPAGRRILVVDRAPWHTLRPKLPEAVGGYCRCSVRLPLAELLTARHISFLQAEVASIDPETHRVFVQTDVHGVWPVEYGTLLVALGSEPASAEGPGQAARLLPLWSFDDACGLRRRLALLSGRARRYADSAPLSVAIVGGGFVGVEVASAVAGLTRALVAGASLQPRITLIERAPRLLPFQPARFSARVAAALETRGVQVLTGRAVSGIGSDGLTLEDGTLVPAVTLIWTGGVRPHPAAAALGSSALGGRIPVSARLEAQDHPDVFAVGDNAAPPGPEPPSPFARSAATAAAMGRLAAENVTARWHGGPGRSYRVHPEPLLIEFDPRHVLGLTPSGRILVWPAPLLKQAAMARHLWHVGGWPTLRAMFRATFWDPLRRSGPEAQCPPPEAQEATPSLRRQRGA